MAFEYCAVRRSVGGEPTAHRLFESSNVNTLWCKWCPRSNDSEAYTEGDFTERTTEEAVSYAHTWRSFNIDFVKDEGLRS
ncbi:hypothetical protein TNCV_1682831 [Trichonephila clavipes]|nr:hypothetical protein TNCV_1682831 [Trichonephila clavipes]